MNKSFTGIYRPPRNSSPFPELSARPWITSGSWSWTGESSDTFASAQGRQILFKGTIENLSRLRQDLGLPGTAGAARTALQLYLKYGEAFPLEIQGGFCFAILDSITGELLLGRDYLGRQSFFWAKTGDSFIVFSDRLGNLKDFFPEKLKTDLGALNEYLARGCISAPRTIYENIRRLEAASLVHITGDGRVRQQRYWHPEYLPKFTGKFSAAMEQCRGLLQDATEQCCTGREYLACLLSGGLDSGLVLGTLRRFTGTRPFRAVTVSFENPLYDEAPLACLTAARFGVQLDLVKARSQDLEDIARRYLSSQEEPYSDSSLLPLTLACRTFAEEPVPVFTGDGGDEVFGGYRRYQAMLWRQLLNHRPAREILQSIYFLERVMFPDRGGSRSFHASLHRFIHALHQDTLNSFLSYQNIFSPEFRRELCAGQDFAEAPLPFGEMFSCLRAEDDCERCMALDLLSYLPYDCLRKSELAGLDSGVEFLSPLLSRPLVEFALSLPRSWKTTLWHRKRPIRALAQKMLPGKILQQNKRGFGVPLGEWLRTSWKEEVLAMARDLTQWDAQGWLNPEFVQALVQEHLQGHADHSARIWNLICLQKWLEKTK